MNIRKLVGLQKKAKKADSRQVRADICNARITTIKQWCQDLPPYNDSGEAVKQLKQAAFWLGEYRDTLTREIIAYPEMDYPAR